MVNVTNICSECADVITEPLCVLCFEREVFSWVSDQDFSKSGKEEIISIINRAKLLSHSDTQCIICSELMQNICNYCIMKEVAKVMERYGAEIPNNSSIVFNYHIYHSGLQRKKEVLKWH